MLQFSRRVLPAAAVLLFAASLRASSFVDVDLSSLTRMSEAVVEAQVEGVTSAWNADRSMIFTTVSLAVTSELWGGSPLTATGRVELRVPGGRVDDFVAEMAGAPRFVPGERVVVFLGRWDDGAAMVAGYEQGVSRVTPDAAGNLVLRGGVAGGQPLQALAETLARIRK